MDRSGGRFPVRALLAGRFPHDHPAAAFTAPVQGLARHVAVVRSAIGLTELGHRFVRAGQLDRDIFRPHLYGPVPGQALPELRRPLGAGLLAPWLETGGVKSQIRVPILRRPGRRPVFDRILGLVQISIHDNR